jgi:hypothetical protein
MVAADVSRLTILGISYEIGADSRPLLQFYGVKAGSRLCLRFGVPRSRGFALLAARSNATLDKTIARY